MLENILQWLPVILLTLIWISVKAISTHVSEQATILRLLHDRLNTVISSNMEIERELKRIGRDVSTLTLCDEPKLRDNSDHYDTEKVLKRLGLNSDTKE